MRLTVTPHYENDRLTALRITVPYAGGQADLGIRIDGRRSLELGLPEIARIEIQQLIEVLEGAAASSDNIAIADHPPPGRS